MFTNKNKKLGKTFMVKNKIELKAPGRFSYKNRLSQLPLSDICKSVILGTLLGDGSLKINKNYLNARFSCRHSIVQSDYFYWKALVLKEILGKKSIHIQKADGYSTNKKLRLQSRALPSLTLLHSIVCIKNKLHIRRHWLNHLTALSLAVWWLDDGSIIGNGRKGVICTESFDKKSLEILSAYLEKVWNVKMRVGKIEKKTGKEYYRLWINTTQLQIFLKIVLPYIPVSSMIKKVIIKYKDPKLQQRWISTVKESLSEGLKENLSEELKKIFIE